MLTAKQKIFCLEYLKDLNASAAYKRAGYKGEGHVAASAAARLLTNVDVAQEIEKLIKERAEKTGITADRVLLELWSIATADANGLVEYRRNCCRHCWGIDFGYQRTLQEMERAYDAYEHRIKTAKNDAERAKIGEFDEQGSIGYDARRQPHEECPECFGEGVGTVFLKDTRNLPPELKSLYAGVKVTRNGVEVMTHSKDKALEMLGRHLKLFTDVVEVKDHTTMSTRMKAARARAKEKKAQA